MPMSPSLYFAQELSKTQIAKQTGLSKQFVVNWIQSLEQDLDKRGCPKGQGCLWDKIVNITPKVRLFPYVGLVGC